MESISYKKLIRSLEHVRVSSVAKSAQADIKKKAMKKWKEFERSKNKS